MILCKLSQRVELLISVVRLAGFGTVVDVVQFGPLSFKSLLRGPEIARIVAPQYQLRTIAIDSKCPLASLNPSHHRIACPRVDKAVMRHRSGVKFIGCFLEIEIARLIEEGTGVHIF